MSPPLDFPFIDQPLKDTLGRPAPLRKLKALSEPRPGVKVYHVQNMGAPDKLELELQGQFDITMIPKAQLPDAEFEHFRAGLKRLVSVCDNHVVKHRAAFQDSKAYYVVKEHCAVHNILVEKSVGSSALDESRLPEIALQCLQGLAALHERGITYQVLEDTDIKFSADGLFKLDYPSFLRLGGATAEAEKRDVFMLGKALHRIFYGKPAHPLGYTVPTGSDEASGSNFLAQLMPRDSTKLQSAKSALTHPWLLQANKAVVVDETNTENTETCSSLHLVMAWAASRLVLEA